MCLPQVSRRIVRNGSSSIARPEKRRDARHHPRETTSRGGNNSLEPFRHAISHSSVSDVSRNSSQKKREQHQRKSARLHSISCRRDRSSRPRLAEPLSPRTSFSEMALQQRPPPVHPFRTAIKHYGRSAPDSDFEYLPSHALPSSRTAAQSAERARPRETALSIRSSSRTGAQEPRERPVAVSNALHEPRAALQLLIRSSPT